MNYFSWRCEEREKWRGEEEVMEVKVQCPTLASAKYVLINTHLIVSRDGYFFI
jgi:hypothetical protein